MRNTGKNQGLTNNNQGFSLIEILVCVTILAIFCIPLFQGFRYSAYNNNRAHHTQSATAYAQQTLESVKTMRIDTEDTTGAVAEAQLEALLEDIATGTAPTVNGRLYQNQDMVNSPEWLGRDDFTQFRGDADFDPLFRVFTCVLNGIDIGGKDYNMEVVLNPLPYSQPNSNAADANLARNPASDANVAQVAPVEDVDEAAVIPDDVLHRREVALDPSQGAAVLSYFQEQIKDRFNADWTLAQVYQGLTKTVVVKIYDGTRGLTGSGDTVEVYCDVRYELTVNSQTLSDTYNAYQGTFPGWDNGGRIYLTAKAYRENGAAFDSSSAPINIVEIDATGYTAAGNLDVYLTRSVYPAIESASLNFDDIIIGGNSYYRTAGTVLTGEWSSGRVNLHTNIKGTVPLARFLTNATDTMGMAVPSLRSYDVTVTLTEADTGDVVARVTSTKRVK